MEGLKHCPFCGCDNITAGLHPYAKPAAYYTRCKTCGATGPKIEVEIGANGFTKAINAWNNRLLHY